jgi:hypothetical protein
MRVFMIYKLYASLISNDAFIFQSYFEELHGTSLEGFGACYVLFALEDNPVKVWLVDFFEIKNTSKGEVVRSRNIIMRFIDKFINRLARLRGGIFP